MQRTIYPASTEEVRSRASNAGAQRDTGTLPAIPQAGKPVSPSVTCAYFQAGLTSPGLPTGRVPTTKG